MELQTAFNMTLLEQNVLNVSMDTPPSQIPILLNVVHLEVSMIPSYHLLVWLIKIILWIAVHLISSLRDVFLVNQILIYRINYVVLLIQSMSMVVVWVVISRVLRRMGINVSFVMLDITWIKMISVVNIISIIMWVRNCVLNRLIIAMNFKKMILLNVKNARQIIIWIQLDNVVPVNTTLIRLLIHVLFIRALSLDLLIVQILKKLIIIFSVMNVKLLLFLLQINIVVHQVVLKFKENVFLHRNWVI